MKIVKRVFFVLLTLSMVVCMSSEVFAAAGYVDTTYYGRLSGIITQSGTALKTTTAVTENKYSGYLYTTIEVTDGYNTHISTSKYHSAAGALSLTNTTEMVTIIRSVAVPGYASYAPEIRGGTKVGAYKTIGCKIDSSVFE